MEAFLTAALTLAPKLVAFGLDLAPLVKKLAAMWNSGADPTDQDWTDLAAMEAPFRAELQRPLPPDDGTTTT
jgi:hypothetical protein